MAESFVGSVGGKLADQFLVQLYTPAYLFWAGSTAMYVWKNWSWLGPPIKALKDKETQVLLLAGAWLVLVTATAAIAQRFERFLIQFLEGYGWPRFLKKAGVFLQRLGYTRDNNRIQQLAIPVFGGGATAEEQDEFTALDLRLRRFPANQVDLMPTALGNVLRAFERRVNAKYGLDTRVCWARLWSVLSKDVRDDLTAARAALNVGARSFIWGGLFAVWTVWVWWAAPVAMVAMFGSYVWMVNTAEDYGELLESAFDTSRFALYRSLSLRLPENSMEELYLGKLINQYLWRGDLDVTFTKIPKDSTTPAA
jgi:hypothetical protein